MYVGKKFAKRVKLEKFHCYGMYVCICPLWRFIIKHDNIFHLLLSMITYISQETTH